jgi:hypothetical protein
MWICGTSIFPVQITNQPKLLTDPLATRYNQKVGNPLILLGVFKT